MWPLSSEQLEIITSNSTQLIELLDADDDLIATMTATDCLTQPQIQELKQFKVTRKRNEKLLEMLKRRGIEHIEQFLQCLGETQHHLLPLFTGKEGTPYEALFAL